MRGLISIVLLLAQLNHAPVSLGAPNFDLRIGFAAPELDGALSEREFLNQIIESELDSLDGQQPCSMNQDDPDSIASRMDRLAERLSMAIDAGADDSSTKLTNELADAVGLQQIVQAYQADQSEAAVAGAWEPPRQYRADLGTRRAEEILEPDNPWIYHGKRLTDKGILGLAQTLTRRALDDERRRFSLEMFDHAAKISREDPASRVDELRRKLREATSLGTKAVNLAYHWADQLYVESDFLEMIPILGLGIKKLKKLGRKPYEIMETVRYMHKLWSKVSTELPQGDSPTRQMLEDERTKRMLTQSGLKAVKVIALKLLTNMSLGAGLSLMGLTKELGAVQEIASRCAYYLFSQLVPRSPYCLIGRGYENIPLEELERDAEEGGDELGSASLYL